MKDGIYNSITITDYHANTTHVSATSIKYAKRSLKEFHWHRTGRMEAGAKSHFDFGNAFELALLDKDGFAQAVSVMPTRAWIDQAMAANPKLVRPTTSKLYQESETEFLNLNANQYIISDCGKESYDTIQNMLESCYQDRVIQSLIKGTEYQLSLFWTDEATGLKMKTRPDICKRKKKVIVNVKTAEDGSPKAFSRELAKYDYPLQACVEMRGCVAAGLLDSVDAYFWLVVEKIAPYNATIYEFSQTDIPAAMDELDYLTGIISRAEKENLWPGYTQRADNPHGILVAEIPLYYKHSF